jgi:hypothetical protein
MRFPLRASTAPGAGQYAAQRLSFHIGAETMKTHSSSQAVKRSKLLAEENNPQLNGSASASSDLKGFSGHRGSNGLVQQASRRFCGTLLG